MIERRLLSSLQEWKNSDSRKPLILRGARQVGKSTLVDEFAKSYDVYLKLNLDEPDDCQLLDWYITIEELIDAIYIRCQQKKEDKPTLLFIDEIQNSPKAVAMLRYFYEKAGHLHVIAAGSLLENLIDTKISFPVGRVQYLALRPCSFLEYLNGIGEDFDKELIENLQAEKAHTRIMKHFKNYCIVGGMPEAVMRYAKNKDILALDDIYDTLITSYSDDVEKYATNDTMTKVMRFIIKNGWTFGGNTISFEHFANSTYRSREMGEAFRTIEKAMLLELAYPVTSALLPLQPAYTRRPKLLWLDTGLINYVAGIREEVFSTNNIQDAWRGKVAEHIVAQELLAYNHKITARRHFWVNPQKGSDAEVDFVVAKNGLCIPIEVKSGINAHLRSLHSYMDAAPHDIAIRIWSNPLSIDEVVTQKGKRFRLINLPFYYIGLLDKILG
ncbi:MAG: AAA family ATPase [Bacteroides sp.]|nr:AAA family ATPase [Bacteroides sp.]